LTKEQKEQIDAVLSIRHELKRAKLSVLESEKQLRQRVARDIKALEKVRTTISNADAVFDEAMSTLSGNLGEDDKKQLLKKHRRAAVEASKDNTPPPLPFAVILARAQAKKREIAQHQLNSIFRGLTDPTEIKELLGKQATEVRRVLAGYSSNEADAAGSGQGMSDGDSGEESADLFGSSLDDDEEG
jgi:hypothetical protein